MASVGRKFGRTCKSPSHMRYNNEQRWVKNKAKRIAKHMRKFVNYLPYNLDPFVKIAVDRLLGG